MNKSIIMTIVLALTAGLTYAQDNKPAPVPPGARSEQGRAHGTPQERAKQATDRLNGLVTLTADQYQKVLEVNINFNTQKEALRVNGGQPGEDMRSKVKVLSEDRDTKLKAILTADQWKKRDEARKAQMNERGGFRPEGAE